MLTLGPFSVAPDGSLAPRTPGVRPALSFAWRGRPCEALVTESGLDFRAIAGRIPSTATPAGDRTKTIRRLAGLPAAMPHGWQVNLTADHSLALAFSAPPRRTAVSMLAETVRFCLALDCHLDRLERMGIARTGGLNDDPRGARLAPPQSPPTATRRANPRTL